MSAAKKIKLDNGSDGAAITQPKCDDSTAAAAAAAAASGESAATSIESLSVDIVAMILGHLSWIEILTARVCKKFKDAAAIAPVPLTETDRGEERGGVLPDYCADSRRAFDALTWLARALPGLQQIYVSGLRDLCLFEDGEDPLPGAPGRGLENRQSRQISIVAEFQKLRSLNLWWIGLNGRYPCLFRFSNLQKLNLQFVDGLKLDMEMLSAFPILEELYLTGLNLRGNIKCLRALKDTLRNVDIQYCDDVHGNFMDLADFPVLEKLSMNRISVVGDICHIKDNNFPKLRELKLPQGVRGSKQRMFEHVADAQEIMNVLCRLKSHNSTVIDSDGPWILSDDSPDRYPVDIFSLLAPPFRVYIVQAGPRIGWRWTNEHRGGSCETNWFNEEPDKESDDYDLYMKDLSNIQSSVRSFRGYFVPPTEEQDQRLGVHW